MRKQILGIVIGIAVLFGVSGNSHALLVDNGDGTVTQTRGDGTNLMWLKDANMAGTMTWDNAVAWADSLHFAGYEDWRLPAVIDIGNDGCNYAYSDTDCGFNVDTSTGEMAYLFYTELGNLAYYDTSGSAPQAGWGLSNIGSFNIQSDLFWSGTSYAPNTSTAWHFDFRNGYQVISTKDSNFYAWAVRPGEASAVPEPGTMLLLGSGLAGLVMYRKKMSR